MDNYATHLFTDAVQAEQERAGMWERYTATYEKRLREAFDGKTRRFIVRVRGKQHPIGLIHSLAVMAACQSVGADGFDTDDLMTLNTATVLAPLGLTPSTTDRTFLTMDCTTCADGTHLALRLRDDFADRETAVRENRVTADSLMGSCPGATECLRADTQISDAYVYTYVVRDQVDWFAASVDIYAGGDALKVEVIGPNALEVGRLALNAAELLIPTLFE